MPVLLNLVNRIFMGENINTLIRPVGIAEKGMALSVFVDHKFDRQISHRFDLIMQRRRQPRRGATIDNDNTLRRHNKAQVVVMTRVFISRRGRRANRCKNMRDKFNRLGV